MKITTLVLVSLFAGLSEASLGAQAATYPPLREYLMPRDAEMALVKSAAPANITDRATIKVLTPSGYQVAHEGENGFVCLVMRGWAAPTYTPKQLRDWHPHVMVFAPYYDNAMLGGNEFGSPLPQLSDDTGTPFAVIVIPVDHNLAVKARGDKK